MEITADGSTRGVQGTDTTLLAPGSASYDAAASTSTLGGSYTTATVKPSWQPRIKSTAPMLQIHRSSGNKRSGTTTARSPVSTQPPRSLVSKTEGLGPPPLGNVALPSLRPQDGPKLSYADKAKLSSQLMVPTIVEPTVLQDTRNEPLVEDMQRISDETSSHDASQVPSPGEEYAHLYNDQGNSTGDVALDPSGSIMQSKSYSTAQSHVSGESQSVGSPKSSSSSTSLVNANHETPNGSLQTTENPLPPIPPYQDVYTTTGQQVPQQDRLEPPNLLAPPQQPSGKSSQRSLRDDLSGSLQPPFEINQEPGNDLANLAGASFGEQQLTRDWTVSLEQQSRGLSWFDGHKVMAYGVALFDWDGFIPGRSTRGLAFKKGTRLAICNIVNEHWYQAHRDICEYVPKAFVGGINVLDKVHRHIFQEHTKSASAVSVNQPFQPPPPKPKLSFFGWIAQIFCCSAPKLPMESFQPVEKRPEIPPPPFEREPHVTMKHDHRVLVDVKSESFQSKVVVKFCVTLIPAPKWRFTTFSFNADLPPGCKILEVHPQRVDGPSTELNHNTNRNQEIAVAVAGRGAGVAAEVSHRQRRSQEVEYMREKRAILIGGGSNSGTAVWRATENAAEGSGMADRLELSILLAMHFTPPKVNCSFSAELGRENGLERSGEKTDRLRDKWEFNFTTQRR